MAHPGILLAVILAYILGGSIPAASQTVAVQSGQEQGHGFLVRQGGACYLLLPKHVAAGRRNVTVFSAAPVEHSGAFVETPFWEGMDLAIGVVRGTLERRCVRNLSDLDASVRPEEGARAQLLRLRPSGEPERIDMVVTDSRYLTLEAEIADGRSELFKGTSGAFLFAGDAPLGMIVEALSPTRGRFIRIEEIFHNVNRRIDRRSGFAVADAPAPAPAEEDALPFRFMSATLPPVDPDNSEANLHGPGAYVFRLTRPNRIAFRLDGADSEVVSRVTIRAAVDGVAGPARDVRIDVSTMEDGSRPRSFATAEMGPDGVLDIRRSQTRALWVFVTIASGWTSPVIGVESVAIR